jgi:monoamine oxidase
VRSVSQRHPTELGAEFIHGKDAVTWKYINEFGLETQEFPSGKAHVDGALNVDHSQQCMAALHAMAISASKSGKGDTPLKEFLRSPEVTVLLDQSHLTRRQLQQLLKNDLSAPLGQLSVQSLVDVQTDGYQSNHRIVGGYGELIRRAAEGLDIRTGCPVRRIVWEPQNIDVFTAREKFHARYAVITLPVGVLQARDVAFDPALPKDFLDALHALDPGRAVKSAMVFRRNEKGKAFWPDDVPQIITPMKTQLYWRSDWGEPQSRGAFSVNNLTAGLDAEYFDDEESPVDRMDILLRQLGHIFGRSLGKMRSMLKVGKQVAWHNDQYAKTGYSTLRAEGDPAARKVLGTPIHNTLFFAGEATRCSEEDVASVHGAIDSGLITAQRILACEKVESAA